MNVSKAVSTILKNMPFYQEGLAEGLINTSALARKIRPRVEALTGEEVKEGAIVMAIKRMPLPHYRSIQVRIKHFIGELGDVLVRSGLCELTYSNSRSLLEKQARFSQKLAEMAEPFYSVNRGVTETTIIIDQKLEQQVLELFNHEHLICRHSDLASVTVKLPNSNMDTEGVYYFLLKQLASEGVNIIEMISTSNEFTVVVNHQIVDRAFSVLMGLKREVAMN